MELVPVTDKQREQEFIQVNIELHRKVPNYIRPLDKDIIEIFDPKQNKAFRHGECIRWILKDEDGKLCGRIAAFVNKKYKNKGDDVPTGGIGFFDCINDQAAADMLFDTAKHWLIQHGMQAMDGPINFGERERWWGLVTTGFHEPMYRMNFNPPYYKNLFENYGFKLFFDQVCFGLDPKKKLSPRMYERHDALARDPKFRADYLRKNNLEKYVDDFTTIYNKAWAGHGGLKELRREQVAAMFNQMKPVMDEKILWFAYYGDEPAAMFINLPDLNQWFKYLDGKFDLLHKLKFLWVKRTKVNTKFTGIVFGIVPEYQGIGIDAFMIVEAAKIIQPYTAYTAYEMQWIGDFNPKMINLAERLGDTFRSRILTTYRYLFDRTKEFKRHPMLS
ncbi:MAG: hypothetical protein C5B59_04995 [Bacteroidetes bacterium]|nr:MAG: hypothetical protein C5B59_04995 [Bacteroidota bacterium]